MTCPLADFPRMLDAHCRILLIVGMLIRAADGAKAYRLYLQQGTPSARRLHYWQLADGRIELANVGFHDVISIR